MFAGKKGPSFRFAFKLASKTIRKVVETLCFIVVANIRHFYPLSLPCNISFVCTFYSIFIVLGHLFQSEKLVNKHLY